MRKTEPGRDPRRERRRESKFDQKAYDQSRIALELAYGAEEAAKILQKEVEQGWFDYSADHKDIEGSSLSIEVTRYLRHMGAERLGRILNGMDRSSWGVVRELMVTGNIEKLVSVLDAAENRDRLAVLWAQSSWNHDFTPVSPGGGQRLYEYMLDRQLLVDRYKQHADRVRANEGSTWDQIEEMLDVKGLLEDKSE